jgi:nitrite reductase (NO-forming)
LILVDPKEGLPKVDKEFYIVQGELYTVGQLGKKGLVAFDSNALLDGNPNYVVFNGKIEGAPRMHAKVGEKKHEVSRICSSLQARRRLSPARFSF